MWSSVPIEQLPFSQLNTEPVGSGPFSLKKANRDESGLITSYVLEANTTNRFAPHISRMELTFFNEYSQLLDAFSKGQIDASAYVQNEDIATITKEGSYRVISKPLPRVFGVFFNQNKSAALRDPAVRKALHTAIDRDALIEKACLISVSPLQDLSPTQ